MFSDMESSGVCPTVVTYNVLIDGLCKKRMLDEAFGFKEKMMRSLVNPSVVTFNVLINGLVKSNRFGDVDGVLQEMEEIGICAK